MPIFQHPEFISMTKDSCKKNKELEKSVTSSVIRSINTATQWTLNNIYPQGQFGFIKPTEYKELLDMYTDITKKHKLTISAKKITPAIKFKANCTEYSKDNGTENVSEAKYRQVQANIDILLEDIKKPLQVLKKDGSKEDFDFSKVNDAIAWAAKKPKI